MSKVKTYCLVCGYGLGRPIELGTICPSCGTQYGISDETMTYEQLRDRWVTEHHAAWWSKATPPPPGWTPYAQLICAQTRPMPVDEIPAIGTIDVMRFTLFSGLKTIFPHSNSLAA